MGSSNLEAARAVFEGFNRRDLDAAAAGLAEGSILRDHPSGRTFTGAAAYKEFLSGWIKAFSDGKLTLLSYYDGGDAVACEGTYVGTNDGPLGPLPATGRRASLPFSAVWRFDAQGRIAEQEAYYDNLGLMVQLGHAEPPPTA